MLDDGWFGEREDDTSSLGDWKVNLNKLPGGLKALADEIEKNGVKFGLWFEPEMVSPDSELYRKHPDWCIHAPGRRRSLCRNQLTLDLSRGDVRQYIIKCLDDILSNVKISYVKWDMNRHMSNLGSAMLSTGEDRENFHIGTCLVCMKSWKKSRKNTQMYYLKVVQAEADALMRECCITCHRYGPVMIRIR